VKQDEDARRAVVFLAGKFVLFAVLPVIAAGIIVYFTLPA
jgi:hypothetical protein